MRNEGNISLHFNEIDTAWQSHGSSSSFNSNQLDPTVAVNENSLLVPSLSVKTYTANSSSSLPGTLLCNQTDPNCTAGDLHAKAAHKYAIGTFDLYATQFGRNSIDNNGMTITSTVHYCKSILFRPKRVCVKIKCTNRISMCRLQQKLQHASRKIQFDCKAKCQGEMNYYLLYVLDRKWGHRQRNFIAQLQLD